MTLEEKIKKDAFMEAADDVLAWADLSIKAHKEFSFENPKEANREFLNQMRLLGVIRSSFLRKAGYNDKDRFEESKLFSKAYEAVLK